MWYPPSLKYRVGEPSIGKANPPPLFDYPRGIAVIALSSPHRKEAISASQEIFGRSEAKGSDIEESITRAKMKMMLNGTKTLERKPQYVKRWWY